MQLALPLCGPVPPVLLPVPRRASSGLIVILLGGFTWEKG